MTPQTPTPSFTIDADMVKHVAFLVRLGIQEEQAQAFSHQFSAIIDYFHLLERSGHAGCAARQRDLQHPQRHAGRCGAELPCRAKIS